MTIKLKATKESIRRFIESPLWDDMKSEISTWSELCSHEMDSIVDESASSNPSTAAVLMHLGDINGRKKAVSYFLSLPELFLQLLEEENQNESDE